MLLKLLFRTLPDRVYLQLLFFKHFHRFINFKNPKTFNEKLQWLKIYDRKPEYTTMVDKYLVKDYVASKIGKEYIIPTIGVWDNFEEIDFSNLPNQFVLKWNHDSHCVVICKDKTNFDIDLARKKISRRKHNSAYWYGREWPYKNVKPKIIAEKYMEDHVDGELRDYKFYTFGGVPKFLLISTNRYNKEKEMCFDYFDMQGNKLNYLDVGVSNNPQVPHMPINLKKMQELCSVLAERIPFVRVDFYEVNGQMYFGELTFFDSAGFTKMNPPSWAKEWGDLIELPL